MKRLDVGFDMLIVCLSALKFESDFSVKAADDLGFQGSQRQNSLLVQEGIMSTEVQDLGKY